MRILPMIVATAACAGEPAPPGTPIWMPLVTKAWSLDPGEEKTSDIHIIDLDRDIYVGGIRPISPVGTHHTVLARGQGMTGNIIYASGVGTGELMFPEGVGVKLPAGSLLGLQLHIFNVTDAPLAGSSGVEIIEVAPDEILEEAELLLAGPTDLELPPNEATTLTGRCTVTAPQTVFALFPHMHQLGTHFKTTLTIAGEPRVVHDMAYAFDEQAFSPIGPFGLEPGDTIASECTWTNPTASSVTWGESSTTEMCFSILYRYPSFGGGFCTE